MYGNPQIQDEQPCFMASAVGTGLQTAQAFAKYVAQYDIGKIAQLPFPQSLSWPSWQVTFFYIRG